MTQPSQSPHDPSQAYSTPPQQSFEPASVTNALPPVDNSAPVTPKKTNPILRYLAPALAALLVIGGLAFLVPRISAGGFMKTGQCVELYRDATTGDAWRKADCNKDGVITFTVGKTGKGDPSCASEAYLTYTLTDKKTGKKKNYACLVPNLKVDNCYVEARTTPAKLQVTPCTRGATKVTKKERAATINCASGDHPWQFADEKISYCLSASK